MARILVITHQLSHTGAPIVLLDMVRTLQGAGYEIEMISLLEGELRKEVEAMGIPLKVQNHFIHDEEAFRAKLSTYDAVIVNTLLGYEVIHILKYMQVPVLWWIHEGEHFFEYFKSVIPDMKTLTSNIHIYSVSGYVQRIIQKRYDVWTPILHFGVKDSYDPSGLFKLENLLREESEGIDFEVWDPGHKKIRFLTVALYGDVKGQDFAIQAIEKMPEELRKKCLFVFCGEEARDKADMRILGPVLEASEKYDEVMHIPRQEHASVLNLMSDMDYLLVPSRIEPMPTVACEAMMMKRPVVISDVCGVADDLTDGWDGILFHTEDVMDFQLAISRAVEMQQEEYESMCRRARAIYDEKYAMSIFEPNVLGMMSHIYRRRKLIMMLSGRDILDIFSLSMEEKFREMGYEVMEFDNRDIASSLGRMDTFIDSPVTAAVAFNNTGFCMEIVPGKNIWEQLEIPYIDFLMDHPFAHKEALDKLPSTGIVLCPDRNHMKYVQRFYPEIGTTGFMVHAGKEMHRDVPRIKDRKVDVMYAGNLPSAFVRQIQPDFDTVFKDYDINMGELSMDAYRELVAHPEETTEAVIEKLIVRAGGKFMDDEMSWIIEKLRFVDLLAVSYYREMSLRLLAEAGVSIALYGTGWENCDFVKLPNVHYNGRISAEEVVDQMHDAKIVLSTMTWFKDGTHDRVFNGMLAGAVALTDSSIYMKENFDGIRMVGSTIEGVHAGTGLISETPELVMFELEKKMDHFQYPTIHEMPALVKRLLAHPDYMQQIADAGRTRAKKTETWAARAIEMDQDLLEML